MDEMLHIQPLHRDVYVSPVETRRIYCHLISNKWLCGAIHLASEPWAPNHKGAISDKLTSNDVSGTGKQEVKQYTKTDLVLLCNDVS